MIDDAIRGHVEWDCALIPDPVILRSDGSPLYNFATVIDDIDLRISHVIRAEEHLTNTAVQVLVYEALGAAQPIFAHVPYVAARGPKRNWPSGRSSNIARTRSSSGCSSGGTRFSLVSAWRGG